MYEVVDDVTTMFDNLIVNC